jgi:hypothetical protein
MTSGSVCCVVAVDVGSGAANSFNDGLRLSITLQPFSGVLQLPSGPTQMTPNRLAWC